MFETIQARYRVTIIDAHGNKRTGSAVMRTGDGSGWVLNMGGKHGTPALAYPDNVVKVRKNNVKTTD